MKWQKIGLLGPILLTLLLMTTSVKATEPILLVEGAITSDNWSVSRNGQWLAWGSYGDFRVMNLVTGEEQAFRIEGGIYDVSSYNVLSPNGDWMYFMKKNGSEWFTCRVNVSNPETIELLYNHTNVFTISPSGDQLAYWRGEEIEPDHWVRRLYIRNSDGSGTPTHILELESDAEPGSIIDWSVNDQIIFTMTSNGDRQVRTIDCFGEYQMAVLGTNTSCEYFRWSPDGTRLCYINHTGYIYRLFVSNAYLANPRWIPLRSSTYGSNEVSTPQWKDNHNIIFASFRVSYVSKLYIVNVDAPPTIPIPPDYSPVMLIGVAVGAGLLGATLASIVMWVIIRRRT